MVMIEWDKVSELPGPAPGPWKSISISQFPYWPQLTCHISPNTAQGLACRDCSECLPPCQAGFPRALLESMTKLWDMKTFAPLHSMQSSYMPTPKRKHSLAWLGDSWVSNDVIYFHKNYKRLLSYTFAQLAFAKIDSCFVSFFAWWHGHGHALYLKGQTIPG